MMKKMLAKIIRALTMGLLSAYCNLSAGENVIVIGHPNLKQIDQKTIERIYTGKQIQIGEMFVTAINAEPGSAVRGKFLQTYLKQDEDRYTGYWRVRRSVGQGKPPREFIKSIDIINFVNSTPGAIGYISDSDYQPGLNVLIR